MIPSSPKAIVQQVLLTGALVLGAAIPLLHAQSNLPRTGSAETRDDQQSAALRHKLASIIILRLEFHATTLADAVEYLRQESRVQDHDPNPETRGVNILLKLPGSAATVARPSTTATDASIPGLPATPDVSASAPAATSVGALPSANTRITLTLNRIPLMEALKYIATQAGLRVKVEPYAVSLVPSSENTEEMVTASFRVPPNFIGNESHAGGGSLLDQPATSATAH